MRDRVEMDLEERGDVEGLRELEGGETIIKMYCTREESIANK